jgi:hypothetical protein
MCGSAPINKEHAAQMQKQMAESERLEHEAEMLSRHRGVKEHGKEMDQERH